MICVDVKQAESMIPKSPFTPKQQDLQALTLAKWTFTLFNSLKLALKVFQLLANSLKRHIIPVNTTFPETKMSSTILGLTIR